MSVGSLIKSKQNHMTMKRDKRLPFDSPLNALSRPIMEWRIHQGFITPDNLFGDSNKATMLGKLMLVTTEVAEMAEAVRDEDMTNFGEELADVIIRILDIGATTGLNIDALVAAKMVKNKTRPKLHNKKCAL